MKIEAIIQSPSIYKNRKLAVIYGQFSNLLDELRKKELPQEFIVSLNKEIEHINAISDSEKELKKQFRKILFSLLKRVEKELKMVPKKHYRNQWMAVGMSAIGIPIGVVFGLIMDNMAYLGIGLPIGIGIGVLVGNAKDKKVLEEGRQLDLEINY